MAFDANRSSLYSQQPKWESIARYIMYWAMTETVVFDVIKLWFSACESGIIKNWKKEIGKKGMSFNNVRDPWLGCKGSNHAEKAADLALHLENMIEKQEFYVPGAAAKVT
jgi:hypothetical protein